MTNNQTENMSMLDYTNSLYSDIETIERDFENINDEDAREHQILHNIVRVLTINFSDYDLLVEENKKMALKLKSMGLTQEDISNVCNG